MARALEYQGGGRVGWKRSCAYSTDTLCGCSFELRVFRRLCRRLPDGASLGGGGGEQRELLEAYGRLAAAGREEARVRAELSAGRARAMEAAVELKRQLVFGQQLQEEHKAGTPHRLC